MDVVRITGVEKRFGGELVLAGITMSVGKGESIGIAGPNGCGKTTLLRIIAGVEKPDKGQVEIHGSIGMVPQENLLLPWRSIRGNLMLPLRIRGVSREESENMVEKVAELLGITEYLDKYPSQVSGGTARKASIARALVLEPDILLLDEPYTGLDAKTISSLQETLRNLRSREGITMIIVSHQLNELVEVTDKIYVLTHKPTRIKTVIEKNRINEKILREILLQQ